MATTALLRPRAVVAARATTEPVLVKALLVAAAVSFLLLFLVVPLVAVFVQAFEKGWAAYLAALGEPMALSALKLTLLTAGVAVPLNLLFGVAAAWTRKAPASACCAIDSGSGWRSGFPGSP